MPSAFLALALERRAVPDRALLGLDKAQQGRRWLNLGLLGLIASALMGAFFLIFQTVEAERAERAQVRRTNLILLEMRNIQRAALRAETGQRGYLITLDRRYLEPYRQGRREIGPSVKRLEQLIGPDAPNRQKELVDAIGKQAAAQLAELDANVEMLNRRELIAARRRILTDTGQKAMEGLQSAIGEMAMIEQEVLDRQATETARAEARLIPLLGLLLFLVLVFILFGIRLVARTATAEAEAAQASALAEARDRADLLARELNHRVKNLFAMILAIVQMSGRNTSAARPVVESISSRIRALLTAHEVTQGAADHAAADLRALVEATLAPYRSSSQPAHLDGPEIALPSRSVTPLGLVLHELTTNAVKYGAWAHGGSINISWASNAGQLAIEWREAGPENIATPQEDGFGSMLMSGAARQLNGTINRQFLPQGCVIMIEFPVDALPTTG